MTLLPTLIADNLFSDEEIANYELAVMSGNWKFLKDMSYSKSPVPSYGFAQPFKHPDQGILSPLYEGICVPIVNRVIDHFDLKIEDVYHCRSFLQLPLNERFVKVGRKNGVHLDTSEPHYAMVYYMNDTDGETIIYNQTSNDIPPGTNGAKLHEHKRVMPKKGKVVLFDGSRYHCSSQPSIRYRCIINFNLVWEK